MADKTVPDLTAAATLDGTELVHVVQGGNSRKATTAAIAALAGGGGSVDGIEGSESVLRYQYANGVAGSTTVVGLAISNQGSAGAPAVTSTNRLSNAYRHTRATAGTAGSEAGLRLSSQFARRDAGFTYEFRGGIETLTAGMRLLIGLRASTAFPGNVDPSSLTNVIGFGRDTADTNIQLIHNDASGTATKADTGIALAAGDELYVRIHCDPNGDYEVTLKKFGAANLTNTPDVGGTYTATVSTDIPAASTLLAFLHWINNAATAAAASIAFTRESIRTPF